MNVSPVGGGDIRVAGQDLPSKYPASWTCSLVYQLTALPNTSENYIFDRWEGSVIGTTSPVSVSVSDGAKNVTAYFVKKTNPLSLQDVKEDVLDGINPVLVIDVSNTSDYANSHMLCAKNYVWNSGSNNFSTSITNLNTFKNEDILIYDQDGSMSAAAAHYLAVQGFNAVFYMTDGLRDWEDAGYETFLTGNYPGGDSDVCTSLSPLAFAGEDKAVSENQKVTLDGSGSSIGVTYAWTQAEGNNNVALNNPAAQKPTFMSPVLIGSDDELIFHLTVTDGSGKNDTDSVKITVHWINDPPVADAGQPQTVIEGATVTLDGSGSMDSDGTIAKYAWSQTGGTPTVALSASTAAKPTFTAPSVSASTNLTFRLTVTDNNGASDTDTVQVTVNDDAISPPPNEVPIANAGPDQTVTEGATVTLDSSTSSDSDGTIASREWTQTGGSPTVTLFYKASVKPTFTAPSVDVATVLTFTLEVTDNDGATDTDTVIITVNDDGVVPPNQAPTADAGKDQSVKEGATVVLDGSASSDPDGTIAGYVWTQTDATGIPVTLSGAATAKPTFAAPAVDDTTTFTFALTVTDDKGLTSSANAVSITVTKAGGGGGGGCFISSVRD